MYNNTNDYMCTNQIQINYKGYNLSCVPLTDGYIATIRNSSYPNNNTNPSCFNTTTLLYLDSSFTILSSFILDENPNTFTAHTSYTRGLEDCRLIDKNSLLCACLHTNTHWKPEMCYVEFENNQITKITPLFIEAKQYSKVEKNWLFLNRVNSDTLHLLYWYNPFQIIETNTTTGKSNVIISYSLPNNTHNYHGGSVIYLEERHQYLILLRRAEHCKIIENKWLLINEDYTYVGMSEGFLFPYTEFLLYQMCMSLIRKNKDELYAFVSINDKINYVYTYTLEKIIESIL